MAVNRPYDYDLIVIGAGIAGMVAAVTANGLGRKVAVIEKGKIGGSCTNTTCIPSKALIRLGHACRDIAWLYRLGLREGSATGLDERAIMPHIRRIVKTAYEKDLPETFERIGIDIVPAAATFVDRHRVRADGRILSARSFVIAAGTRPLVPPVAGIENVAVLTNENLYDLERVPKSLCILGGGVDGLEYASAFTMLGVETTVVEARERLLPAADGEVAALLARSLREAGVRLVTGATVSGVADREGAVILSVKRDGGSSGEIRAEKLLVAVGRRPDLEALSLDRAGVRIHAGGIATDRRLCTSSPNIYACGDVVGPELLAVSAEAQAIVAATNAVLPIRRRYKDQNRVSVIFTEPPLAAMGLTEEQAYDRFGESLRVYRFRYDGMRRALIDGRTEGMAKILCDGTGRIVGAHILGEAAGEVIHEIQAIGTMRKPLHRLYAVFHAYPTYAQAIVGRAGQLAYLERMERNLFVRAALHWLPGYANRLALARERLAEAGPSMERNGTVERDLPAEETRPEREIPPSGAGNGNFTADTRPAGADAVILDLRGILDGRSERSFEPAAERAMERSRRILLNLTGLQRMHPEGVGLLVCLAARASRRNVRVDAFGLAPAFRGIARLTGLDVAFRWFAAERDALCDRMPAGGNGYAAATQADALQARADGWAAPVERLSAGTLPADALNLNVDGRKTTGPVQGFGRLWEKIYRLHLAGRGWDPRKIVSRWKAEFAACWPRGNRLFVADDAPIAPGATAVLNLRLPGGIPLATGIRVMHADDVSFSFLTVEGHMLSGWITFSAFTRQGKTVVQVHPLFRAGDPLMEMALRCGGAGQEDRFWRETLRRLAIRLGASGDVEQRNRLVDGRLRWRQAGNVRFNAAIRSLVFLPFVSSRRRSHPAGRAGR